MFGLWDGFFGSSTYNTDVERTAELKNLQKSADTTVHSNAVAARTKDATRDRHSQRAGVAGADFWQGTKENLKNVPNVANKANLGSILGTAHSVFDGQAKASAEGERTARTADLAGGYVAASGAKSESKMHDASLAQADASQQADIRFGHDEVADFSRMANWNMVGSALSAGVSGVGARMSMDGTDFKNTRLGQFASTSRDRVAGWFDRGATQNPVQQPNGWHAPQQSFLGSGSLNWNQHSPTDRRLPGLRS